MSEQMIEETLPNELLRINNTLTIVLDQLGNLKRYSDDKMVEAEIAELKAIKSNVANMQSHIIKMIFEMGKVKGKEMRASFEVDERLFEVEERLEVAENNIMTLLSGFSSYLELEERANDPNFSTLHRDTITAIKVQETMQNQRLGYTQKVLKRAQESLNTGGNGPSWPPDTSGDDPVEDKDT